MLKLLLFLLSILSLLPNLLHADMREVYTRLTTLTNELQKLAAMPAKLAPAARPPSPLFGAEEKEEEEYVPEEEFESFEEFERLMEEGLLILRETREPVAGLSGRKAQRLGELVEKEEAKLSRAEAAELAQLMRKLEPPTPPAKEEPKKPLVEEEKKPAEIKIPEPPQPAPKPEPKPAEVKPKPTKEEKPAERRPSVSERKPPIIPTKEKEGKIINLSYKKFDELRKAKKLEEKEPIRQLKTRPKFAKPIKPIVTKPPAEVNISLLLLEPVLNTLEQMKSTKPVEKAQRKVEAREIINTLLKLVRSRRYEEKPDSDKIFNAINRIIAIDPLLISTAAIILREAGVPQSKYHPLMTQIFFKQVGEIAKQLQDAVKGGRGFLEEGLRGDIDEALSYPLELEGEIQRAKTKSDLGKVTSEEEDFIRKIEDYKEWLLWILSQSESKEILNNSGFDADFFIYIFGKEPHRIYCDPSRRKPEYKPFRKDLEEIAEDINYYQENEKKWLQSIKTYYVQGIINKLKGYLAHATEPTYCQICLWLDINEMRKSGFNYYQVLDYVSKFLLDLHKETANEAVKDVYENVIPELRAAIIKKEKQTEEEVENECFALRGIRPI
jgi:hypothetical protein